ncbi:uncharacterized protein LOC122059917 isoform X3 [Macadamia integrifolia]|uniref:uncharacterized protein LOC122059917 isoform X3 n=1 Tax=Macadamia integrifolia TaxID=60698 RepID=UPI001C534151|nr:uncharacterized protein LOC122059917 isoform X3 [Macadamia integrifolia]
MGRIRVMITTKKTGDVFEEDPLEVGSSSRVDTTMQHWVKLQPMNDKIVLNQQKPGWSRFVLAWASTALLSARQCHRYCINVGIAKRESHKWYIYGDQGRYDVASEDSSYSDDSNPSTN